MASTWARLERAMRQPMKLERRRGGAFDVVGNSGTTYRVEIGEQCTCTCPDHKIRRARCKHILLVLIKACGRGPSDPELSASQLTKEQVASLLRRASCSDRERRAIERERAKESARAVAESGRANDACPICQETFATTASTALHTCGTCANLMHAPCVQRWHAVQRRQGMQPTCAYCRSPA